MKTREDEEFLTDDYVCFECRGYGNDYYINDDGDLVCACDTCAVRKRIKKEG